MRTSTLLLNLLMLLAIVLNAIPAGATAHAHGTDAAIAASGDAGRDADMPCHDAGNADTAPPAPDDQHNPSLPCCDDTVRCHCACTLHAALPSPRVSIAAAPPRAAPSAALPAATKPPALPPLIRPPIA